MGKVKRGLRLREGLVSLARFCCRNHRAVILVAGLVTCLCSIFVYRLIHRLETDIAALIPDDYPSVRTLDDIKSRVGGVGSIIVLAESGDADASRRLIEDLAGVLEGPDYARFVNYVDYRLDVEFFRKNALLYMDTEDLEEILFRVEDRIRHEKVKLSPMFIQLDDEGDDEVLDFSDIEAKYGAGDNGSRESFYVSEDSSIVALEAVAAGTVSNIGFTKEMYAAVQKAVEELDPTSYSADMVVEYGGTFKNKIDEYEVILSDIKSTLVYGVIGVVLILTFYFRQPMAVFFVTIPLVMGLFWAFAITYWVIGNLNTMTGFLFVILFGLGIDFGIHMFARYLEDRSAGADVRKSIEMMMVQTGRAIVTAGLTTGVAFYSLMITDFKGFYEFGFIVGTGVLMSLVAMITVLPAFLVLADEEWGLIRKRKVWGHSDDRSAGRFPFAVPVLAGGVILTVYLAFNLSSIRFEYDFTNLRANLPSSVAVKEKISTIPRFTKLSQSPSVALADSRSELNDVVAAVEAKIAAEDPTPTIHTVKTLWSALPRDQDAKLEVIAELQELANSESADLLKGEQQKRLSDLRDMLEVEKLTVDDLPEIVLRKFSTIDGSLAYFAFIYPSVQLRDGRSAIAFADDSSVIETSGKTFYSSSSSVIFADMLRLMLRDSRTAILVTLLVVFLIVFADFKGVRPALLVMMPLFCGATWMCGVMFLTGMKLNFYNMVALPTIIGMGVDNGVHLYHRYDMEGKGSLPHVLRSTGGAMFVSMLTTMVGFLGLVMATHPGLNSIGVLAVIGIIACFVAAVVLLPALLQVLEDRRSGDRSVQYRTAAK